MVFEIKNREITCISEKLIGDNADYVADFIFDDEWANKAITVRFIHNKKFVDVVLPTEHSCVIPVEVLKMGWVEVGCFTDEMTTTYSRVFINASIKETEGSPVEPTEDVYSQIIELLNSKMLKGDKGDKGNDGYSAYEIALKEGFVGDEEEWLRSLRGQDGENGADGIDGLNGKDGKDGKDGINGKDGANGKDGYTPRKGIDYFDGKNGYTPIKGVDYFDGKDGVSPSATVQRTSTGALITITDKSGTTTAEVKDGKDGQGGEGGKVEEYFYEYAQTSINPNKLYNYSTKKMDSTSNQYCCLYYELKGEKKVRLSGASAGSSTKVAYCFVDASGNVVDKCDFVANETFSNLMLDVPEGAFAIFVNGNGYQSPHLEIATEADRADRNNTQYLFEAMAKRVRYREQFAWKDMPQGHICFSFDDSLDATNEIVDLFIQKNVPCCFGAIPEKLNMGLANGETIAQAMKRGVDTVGCEVLAHGSAGSEIVTADNIDDKDFLYRKFVVNKQKFADLGFDVRGTVRVGGSGNICNDERTDVWMKLFFDYGDLYGVEEPYNHSRVSAGNSEATDKATIDSCALNKNFTVLLFHQPPSYLAELIDYAKAKGLTICNYAYAYDNYGTTVQEKATIDRISNLESAYGNEVMY